MRDLYKKAEKINKKLWDELTPVHIKSYNIEKLKKGGISLDKIQLKEIGEVKGKTLLHLQCHLGTDSLSWARKGAIVTGIDFSEKSIEFANKLKDELNLDAKFICSNIYDLKKNLSGQFDIVYTSQGVLSWLKDLKEWARIIHHFLKPGGIFYIMEIHPVYYMFEGTKTGGLDIIHSYFHQIEPIIWDDGSPDYSDSTYISQTPSYEWVWSMSDILNSLINAGLKIEFFNEYDKTFYKCLSNMECDVHGWWYLQEYKGKLPLMFTLKARKPFV